MDLSLYEQLSSDRVTKEGWGVQINRVRLENLEGAGGALLVPKSCKPNTGFGEKGVIVKLPHTQNELSVLEAIRVAVSAADIIYAQREYVNESQIVSIDGVIYVPVKDFDEDR